MQTKIGGLTWEGVGQMLGAAAGLFVSVKGLFLKVCSVFVRMIDLFRDFHGFPLVVINNDHLVISFNSSYCLLYSNDY